tara:strand:+ start:41066 stop:41224 length:159 start_codon:yes stop_codon:yes gene_type:complete
MRHSRTTAWMQEVERFRRQSRGENLVNNTLKLNPRLREDDEEVKGSEDGKAA